MDRKKVLLLCASHNDLGTVLALKKMGFYIIVTGNVDTAPGIKYADKYIKADYSDKELILGIAREYGIDAICQCCNDYGVYTAAYVAEQLGLPGYDSYDTTLLLHNKDRFKKFAMDLGLITPQTYSFSSKEEAAEWLKMRREYPIILKPSDASAGNGISRADDLEEAMSALELAFAKTRNGHIVIEDFIEGTQHGFCTFLRDRKVVAVCSNNEYSIQNKYRVEIDTFPSSTYEESAPLLIEEIEKIAEVLQLKDGIFHLQYIFKDGKPYILEVMRRILGNMYHVPGNKLTNMDWEYWDARVRVGMSLDAFPQKVMQEGFFSYKTVLAPHDGVVAEISVSDELKNHEYSTYMLEGPGHLVTRWKSEPLGFIFTAWPTMDEMLTSLIDRYGGVEVTMEEQ